MDGIPVAVGNGKLMNQMGISWKECHHVGTIVHIAVDGKYAGHIVIADVVKPTSAQAVAELRKAGVRQTVMLTGDADQVARKVAEELRVNQVYSELLPADKVQKV